MDFRCDLCAARVYEPFFVSFFHFFLPLPVEIRVFLKSTRCFQEVASACRALFLSASCWRSAPPVQCINVCSSHSTRTRASVLSSPHGTHEPAHPGPYAPLFSVNRPLISPACLLPLFFLEMEQQVTLSLCLYPFSCACGYLCACVCVWVCIESLPRLLGWARRGKNYGI